MAASNRSGLIGMAIGRFEGSSCRSVASLEADRLAGCIKHGVEETAPNHSILEATVKKL